MTSFVPGKQFGIELVEANGKNNGTVTGRAYFTCPENAGCLCGQTRCRTGLVYNPRMKEHRDDVNPCHPEQPERVGKIWAALEERGHSKRCIMVKSRHATEDEIRLVHEDVYFKKIEATPRLSSSERLHLSNSYSYPLDLLGAPEYPDVYINQATFPCAMLSAGCVIELTEQVVSSKVWTMDMSLHVDLSQYQTLAQGGGLGSSPYESLLKNGIAVVRPPGHHAEADRCMGYCIFNNVAVAAKVATEKYGVERILIVDWDIHHGNATQHVFYNDSRVLYFSLHRYDNMRFYPCKPDANYTFTGGDDAEGYTVNVAWNQTAMGDAEYLAAFHHVLMPIAYEYSPQLVIVSCGFDAALGDPLGNYCVTPAGYGHMTHLLTGLADGKVVIVLEGGYNLTSISNSMCACAAVLLGDTPPLLEPKAPNESAVECIRNTARVHSRHWKSLQMFS